MKCWKCSNELTDGMSTCMHCGANLVRSDPKTPEGKALRQLYDHCGSDKLLSDPVLLVNGFGDLCPDEKERKNQLKLVANSGVLKMYQMQLKTEGKPTESFNSRVEKSISDSTGLSATVAKELISLFNEMIGWMSDQTIRQSEKLNNHSKNNAEISKSVILNKPLTESNKDEKQGKRPISSSTNQIENQKPKKTRREKITKVIRIVLSLAWIGMFLYIPISNGGFNKLWEVLSLELIAEMLFLFLVVYFLGIRRIK